MRVVIAEDQALLRQGLALLFQDGGHTVTATLADATTLMSLVDSDPPDLIVIDVRMPPTFTTEGAEAARAVKLRHPEVAVLMLSQHIETTYITDLVAYAGFGYLLKDRVLHVDEFLATAQRVAAGGSALDPKVVARLVGSDRSGPLTSLSERERDVLGLMAEGLTNSAIAGRLIVSERTVEAHVRHLLTKLNIPDGADAHRRVLAVLTHVRAASVESSG